MVRAKKKRLINSLTSSIVMMTFSTSLLASESKAQSASGDWFKVSYIADNTYMIEEPKSSQYNISYLIIGNQRALMLDTGSGENRSHCKQRISNIVNQLTDKPVTLLLTHFHFDHNASIDEFDHIAFANIEKIRERAVDDKTYIFTPQELAFGTYPEKAIVNEWLDLGKNIDLGNRVVKITQVKGHTDDSVLVVDEGNKIIFTGDTLYNGPLIVIGKHNYAPYIQTINKMQVDFNDSYYFYGAHGSKELGGMMRYSILSGTSDLLECAKKEACDYSEVISEQLGGNELTGILFIKNELSLIHTEDLH
ncbi:hypothetical protein C0W66_12855 [Photobacterium kishitanii]|nr:hypothetical protein C0W66_12855 [Photobacterium kishitanii]